MEINDKIRTSSWAKLKYYDPAKILCEFRKIERQIAGAQMDEKVQALRTPLLKKHKEGREAALLCHGLGTCVLDTTVWFSPTEDFDYDFVSMWRTEKIEHYAPVQLKEWVPDHVNPYVTLNALISGLQKYKNSKDMIVGIYSNRAGTFLLSEIMVPKVNLAGLWIFGSITPDQSKWFLFGNVINDPQYYEFMYPA
jgi:hypothetical protein